MLMNKITVLTITDRMGYIDTMAKSLREQTFKDFEWVLVDDFFYERRDLVKSYATGINLKHIPPKVISTHPAPSAAFNTGLIHAEGELIYFMSDRAYPHPSCLARHWEIYRKYGPRVFTSGPFIDDLVIRGIVAIWDRDAIGVPKSFFIPQKELLDGTTLKEEIKIDLREGIPLKMKEVPDFISCLAEPFNFQWPSQRVWDYRLTAGAEARLIDTDLYEGYHPSWWWAGKNDSMPLEALLEANGFNESLDGWRGAHDGYISNTVFAMGYRYLMDMIAPCFILSGIQRKKEKGLPEERDRNIKPNSFNLREQRELILKRLEELSHPVVTKKEE